MTARLIAFWLIGGILILTSSWIVGHLEDVIGVSQISYALALFIAFVLVLAGGLAWIAVATSASKH